MYWIEFAKDMDAWETAAPMIQKALDKSNGETDIDDVKRGLEIGHYALLLIRDEGELVAAAVLEFFSYHRKTVLRVWLTGGKKLEDWLPAGLQYIEEYALRERIDMIEVTGREGWERKLDKYGFKKAYVTLLKEVDHERR